MNLIDSQSHRQLFNLIWPLLHSQSDCGFVLANQIAGLSNSRSLAAIQLTIRLLYSFSLHYAISLKIWQTVFFTLQFTSILNFAVLWWTHTRIWTHARICSNGWKYTSISTNQIVAFALVQCYLLPKDPRYLNVLLGFILNFVLNMCYGVISCDISCHLWNGNYFAWLFTLVCKVWSRNMQSYS